jgi:hypothetical protein
VAPVAMATVFEPGDFVRLRDSPIDRVGVVSHIDPDRIASVQVYWHRSAQTRLSDVHQPQDLQLVPPKDVPEYAVALKSSLELSAAKGF